MREEEFLKMYELEKTHWWFTAKRELVNQLYEKYSNGNKILDLGCGTGINMNSFKNKDVFGLDYSRTALDFCRKRGDFKLIEGDATKLPFKNETFDVVTSLDLLEHIQDDKKVLKEIFRVLKKNGILILTTPAHQNLFNEHDVSFGHVRRYEEKELRDKINETGFKIEKFSYWNFILYPSVLIYKFLNKKSNIQPASKPVNFILKNILRIDNKLINHFNLPFGVSLVGVMRK